MTLPVVLIPGLQSGRASWHYQIPALEADGRVVVVPEGHHGAPSIGAMRDIVAPQLPERCHLVAWSMGGYIGLELMRDPPPGVASLTLIATSARPDSPERTLARETALATARAQGVAEAQRQNLSFSLHDPEALDRAVYDGLIATALRIGAEAFESQQRAIIRRPDLRAVLDRIAVPTQVIVGSRDVVTPPELAQEIAARIPGAALHLIEGIGHCAPLEAPDLVTRYLLDFFRATERAATRPRSGSA
jgi:pimeloyl-ACP methyl ester carboxylesterase